LKRGADWVFIRKSELAVFTGMVLLQADVVDEISGGVGRFQRRIHGMPEMGIRAERGVKNCCAGPRPSGNRLSMTTNGKMRHARERIGRQSPGQMVGRLPASAARRLPRAPKSGTALRMDACGVPASCLEGAGSQTFVTGRFVSAAGSLSLFCDGVDG
jgi:hypothetical protein